MKLTTRDHSLSDSILFGGLCGTAGLAIMTIVFWITSNMLIAIPVGLVVLLGLHFYVWHDLSQGEK